MRNPISPEAFADWAEKQPAAAEYNWYSPSNCAIAQYVRFLGNADGLYGRMSRLLEHYAFATPWTFGALAKRIRESSDA